MGDPEQAITMCMSCGGDFLLGPGDPCTKCRKIQSAGSDAEREAVIVSHRGSLSSRSDRLMRLRGYLSAMGAGAPFHI